MALKQEKFRTPQDLCDWVNDNPDMINVIGIANNEFMEFVLFYSTAGNVDIERKPKFDAEAIWENRRRQRGGINGNENQEG